MLAVTRYRVPPPDTDEFLQLARTALTTLAQRPGHRWGVIGRSTDDPELWTMTTRWSSVGDYRRALGAYEVKLHAHPLMYLAEDEPTAFEELITVEGSALPLEHGSDRAPDADTVGLGDALA